ncbi:MAG TPA: trigger factor [Sulfurimonas sp. UBA12504]|nr:MAG TPA: trigger factor [Sulfurimonas sp. UBA12504]
MTSTLEKLEKGIAKLTIEVDSIKFDEGLNYSFNKNKSKFKLDGFRVGKAPRSLVEKMYGEQVLYEEAIDYLLPEAYTNAVREHELKVVSRPDVDIVQIGKGQNLIFTAVVTLKPEVTLGEYKRVEIEKVDTQITDEEINDEIEKAAEANSRLITVEDRPVKVGDVVTIDFEGFVDGVAFEGGKAENFALRLGSAQFIPGFEEQVIGMQKDDEATIKVTFPENYGGKELAGKDAEFKIKVNKIQVKEDVAIDDELAKKMLPGQENATLEELRNQVKIQIENEELSKLYNDELKPALLEIFVEGFNFDLPEFVVDQEIDMALNRSAASMSEDEITELRENAEKLVELRETFRNDAVRSVKATFIIDSLAQAEGVKVVEQEVMQTIYFEAMQMGQDPQKAYEQYKNSGYLPAIQMSMVEDKVLSGLLNSKMKEA